MLAGGDVDISQGQGKHSYNFSLQRGSYRFDTFNIKNDEIHLSGKDVEFISTEKSPNGGIDIHISSKDGKFVDIKVKKLIGNIKDIVINDFSEESKDNKLVPEKILHLGELNDSPAWTDKTQSGRSGVRKR